MMSNAQYSKYIFINILMSFFREVQCTSIIPIQFYRLNRGALTLTLIKKLNKTPKEAYEVKYLSSSIHFLHFFIR